MRDFKHSQQSVTVEASGTYSSPFRFPRDCAFVGALFPAMDDGDIGLEITMDGTNYHKLLDPADGAAAVLCATGNDPAWIDFSDWIRFVPDLPDVRCRFTCASQASGAVTIHLFFRG